MVPPRAPSKPNLARYPGDTTGQLGLGTPDRDGNFFSLPGMGPCCTGRSPSEKSSLFNFRDDRIKATTLTGESAETEFARYLDNHDTAVNPLEFFKSHKSSFPKMFKMIPQIMCAPGSTAAVEGIFSVAGYILSPRRMSFTDENFENQLFANLNRGIFEVSANKLKLFCFVLICSIPGGIGWDRGN